LSTTQPEYKIPDDTKMIIARVIALQTLATDPGHKITMAGAVMHWVTCGLALKYGNKDLVPSEYIATLEEDRIIWQEAMLKYNQGAEFWAHALLPCQDIVEDLIVIAAIENMLDYRQIDYNFTTHMFGPNAYQMEDDEDRARLERDTAKRMGAPGL